MVYVPDGSRESEAGGRKTGVFFRDGDLNPHRHNIVLLGFQWNGEQEQNMPIFHVTILEASLATACV